jgi:CDP-paratose 2-epimerase
VSAFYEFYKNPRAGEVYNLGGGRGNSLSVSEAIVRVEGMIDRKMRVVYVDKNREGDHICYISNMKKFRTHFPNWRITKPLNVIFEEILEAQSCAAS